MSTKSKSYSSFALFVHYIIIIHKYKYQDSFHSGHRFSYTVRIRWLAREPDHVWVMLESSQDNFYRISSKPSWRWCRHYDVRTISGIDATLKFACFSCFFSRSSAITLARFFFWMLSLKTENNNICQCESVALLWVMLMLVNHLQKLISFTCQLFIMSSNVAPTPKNMGRNR